MRDTIFDASAGRGRLRLRLTAVPMGRDLCVALHGGELPHVGAVAVSQARASLAGGGRISATTSVITLLGHKEDELARRVGAAVAAALDATVCVACGIHLDAITPAELRDVEELADELTRALLAALAAG